MHVALPKPRDGISRPPVIPASVARKVNEAEAKLLRTEKVLQVLPYICLILLLLHTPIASYSVVILLKFEEDNIKSFDKQ